MNDKYKSQHVEGIIETSLNMDNNELIVKSTNYVECILYIGMLYFVMDIKNVFIQWQSHLCMIWY